MAWYALIVREHVLDVKDIALSIFKAPLYSKILHVVLSLSQDSAPRMKYKVNNQ